VFTIAKIGRELAQLPIASLNLMLAAPKGHSLTKFRRLRLRDLNDAAFVWFPRRESPTYYDRLMHECFRGGLKSPHIVQEGVNEATILSLVSCGLGVAFVSSATRWRCPESVTLLPVADLKCRCRSLSSGARTTLLRCLKDSWLMCDSSRHLNHLPGSQAVRTEFCGQQKRRERAYESPWAVVNRHANLSLASERARQ
jgi:DNA-binding transcriptional LysR family regulator